MMEHMGADEQPTIQSCQDLLGDCDLMILLLAWRRGWVPSEAQGGNGLDSITALELKFADEHGIPVLAFRATDSWPGNLWDDSDEARSWVREFRGALNRPAPEFEFEDADRLPQFRALLKSALVDFKAKRLEQLAKEAAERDASRGAQSQGDGEEGGPVELGAEDRDNLSAARAGLARGKLVPLVGPGLFDQGPLSGEALARALGAEAGDGSLATSAERRERRLPSREAFLDFLAQCLDEQASQATPSPVHELIAHSDKLRLVVSMSWDLTLERSLDAAGRNPVLITHVLRSGEAEHDGKVAVLRHDAPTEILLADRLDIADDELMVYKPLGSPLLADRFDPDLEIDTVVATELDHLTFLSRLENQHAAVPSVLTRQLQRHPLLFIGCPLDTWHHRLVIQVLRAAAPLHRRVSNLAVRTSASHIERLAWEGLEARPIPLDPTAFAMHILEPPPV